MLKPAVVITRGGGTAISKATLHLLRTLHVCSTALTECRAVVDALAIVVH